MKILKEIWESIKGFFLVLFTSEGLKNFMEKHNMELIPKPLGLAGSPGEEKKDPEAEDLVEKVQELSKEEVLKLLGIVQAEHWSRGGFNNFIPGRFGQRRKIKERRESNSWCIRHAMKILKDCRDFDFDDSSKILSFLHTVVASQKDTTVTELVEAMAEWRGEEVEMKELKRQGDRRREIKKEIEETLEEMLGNK